MNLQDLKDRLPDYAKDLKLNLGALATEPVLSETQRAGAFVACAWAIGQPEVLAAVMGEFGSKLDARSLQAAKSAAAIMSMNNVYYRFVHLASEGKYGDLPARLRMSVLANPGVPKTDFELWSLAVSALNGCGMCIDAHERILRKDGMTADQVQAGVRIAAVLNGVAAVVRAENAAREYGVSASDVERAALAA